MPSLTMPERTMVPMDASMCAYIGATTAHRITFNRSGTHRCDRCGLLFPYTPCYACDLSHDCVDGYFDASLHWEHVYDDEDEEF